MVERNYSKIRFRKRKTLVAESKVCAGCRTCETICSLTHEGCIDLEKSRINLKSNAFRGSFIPLVCRQCADAPCYYACPEDAIRIEEDRTIILEEKCIGCGLCVSTCPTESISMKRKPADKASPVYATEIEMLQALGKERNLQYPFE